MLPLGPAAKESHARAACKTAAARTSNLKPRVPLIVLVARRHVYGEHERRGWQAAPSGGEHRPVGVVAAGWVSRRSKRVVGRGQQASRGAARRISGSRGGADCELLRSGKRQVRRANDEKKEERGEGRHSELIMQRKQKIECGLMPSSAPFCAFAAQLPEAEANSYSVAGRR